MKKYYKFELGMVAANILSLVPLFLGVVALFFIPSRITEAYSANNLQLFLPLLIVYFAAHEIIHGIGYSIFAKDKNNIKYGAKLESGVFYAMCQERISKKGILISLALPTIVLTFLALPIAVILKSGLLVLLAIANLSGAAGDIIMFFALLRMPSDIKYIDYDSTIGAYLISKHDLSKKKYFAFKFVEKGEDSDELINKTYKKVTITKISWIIIALLLLISIFEILTMYL